MANFDITDRTKIKRLPKRGFYDQETVYAILDEGLICHVGFVLEGQPFVIPTAYGRVEDQLYIHGSSGSRMLRSMTSGIDVCVTITLLDGLVLARSIFHHSMNYRSVILFGQASLVAGDDEKRWALKAFSDQMIRGRWEEVREPNQAELNRTLVLSLPLQEASAKVRKGPPGEEEEDYEIPVWAGEIPLRMVADVPVSDPRLLPGIEIPEYARTYSRSSY